MYKDYFAVNSDNTTSQGHFNWDYDIALLKLNDFVQHDVVELAKLPEKSLEISELSNVKCKAAGEFYCPCCIFVSMNFLRLRALILLSIKQRQSLENTKLTNKCVYVT